MIQNAKIVSVNTWPERYEEEKHERGDQLFTVRAHVLTEILRNPKRWVRGYVSPDTKAKEFGSLLDCLLLTPLHYSIRYATLPEDAPRRPSQLQRDAKAPSPATLASIKFWDEFNKKHGDAEVIDVAKLGMAQAACKRLREDALISDLLESSRKQVMVTAEWHDKLTGLVVPLKCLVDIWPHADHPIFGGARFDLKTTKNAAPKPFSRDAEKFGYDLQGAFYTDVCNAAENEHREDFGHIIIESYAPYEYRTPPPLLSQRFLNFGRLLYQRALALYCQCIASGEWPSYDTGKEWPKTDCSDYHLDMEKIYEPIQEEEEEDDEVPEEQPTSQSQDIYA